MKNYRILNKILVSAVAVMLVLSGCGRTDNEAGSLSGTMATDASEAVTESESVKDPVIIEQTYFPVLPTGSEEADIFVNKVEGLSDDFYLGMDISSLLAEEASGVKYYDFEGNEADLFKVLADAGVNSVRVRVWNHPFDEEGHGYGGGNCTVETASIIGARAAAYGMSTCVDFHYSDFWADPNKQICPREWNRLTTDEKGAALKQYTIDSINAILDSGAVINMVQVGNETNNGVAGVKSDENLMKMLKAGCEGVQEVNAQRGLNIKATVHFTSIDDPKGIMKKAQLLKDAEVPYDVFGVSYYPYWHSDMDNMCSVLKDIKTQYGVDTCIMENSYPYTTEDGDDSGNSISGIDDVCKEYPVSVEGQAKEIRDVIDYATMAGALGFYYWEGAWIPVGTNATANIPIWEEFGSGWASSYAGSYDPNDAGKYYGGCSWDNQALFDFEGHPLPSLNVYKYVKYGSTAPVNVIAIPEVKIDAPIGVELAMPETVDAIYNDSDCHDGIKVTWNEDDVKLIDVNQTGKYTVNGTAENGWDICAEVKVASLNYVKNGSFEDPDVSMWKVHYEGDTNPTDIQQKAADAYTGEYAFHYWSPSPIEFELSQKIEKIPAGKYTLQAFLQGSDMGSSEDIYLYVSINGEEVSQVPVKLDGWVKWQNPVINDIVINDGDEVVIGFMVKGDAKGWGTIDDVEMY